MLVIDDPCIESLDHLQPLLDHRSNVNIILLTHSVPDDDMKAAINTALHRGTSVLSVQSLSQLQVTQRLVYHIQTSYHLAPDRQEQRHIEYLASLFRGAACTVPLIWSLVRAWIDKAGDVNDGINSCVEQIKAVTNNTRDRCSPESLVPILIACLIDCGVIDADTRSLLYYLALFDGAPLPMSVITAICDEMDTTNRNAEFANCFSVLVNNHLVYRYPSRIVSSDCNTHPSISDDKLYYVPQYISNAIEHIMDPVDTLVAIKTVSAAIGNLTESVDLYITTADYLPSLVQPLALTLRQLTADDPEKRITSSEIDVFGLYEYCCHYIT